MSPLHAEDSVGRISSDLATWMLSASADLMIAKRDGPREGRSEALTRVFDVWPKICRRMADLERSAPNASTVGAESDAAMQDLVSALPRK